MQIGLWGVFVSHSQIILIGVNSGFYFLQNDSENWKDDLQPKVNSFLRGGINE